MNKRKLYIDRFYKYCFFALISVAVMNCSSVKPPESESIKDMLDYAIRLYENEDYNDSILELESLTYKSRTTEYEDEVLYYLAQSYFRNEQYLLASDTYKRLLQNISNTPYLKKAYYNLAMCYYNMSPRYSLDQHYTKLAIDQFQIFIDGFPIPDSTIITEQIQELKSYSDEDKRLPEYQSILSKLKAKYATLDTVLQAEKLIRICRNKLARKSFEAAHQYINLRAYKSATIYFDEVILSYSDSPYYEQALLGKIEMLMIRKKWDEALKTIDKYKERFPEKVDSVEDDYEQILIEMRKEEHVAVN